MIATCYTCKKLERDKEYWSKRAEKLAGDVSKLERELTAMTAKFERNSTAAGCYSLRVTELEAENASLKDQLQWSLKNEQQYKDALREQAKRMEQTKP